MLTKKSPIITQNSPLITTEEPSKYFVSQKFPKVSHGSLKSPAISGNQWQIRATNLTFTQKSPVTEPYFHKNALQKPYN